MVVAGGLMTWPWGHCLMWWAGRRSLCFSDLDQEEEEAAVSPADAFPGGRQPMAAGEAGGGGWWHRMPAGPPGGLLEPARQG
jgi:hypothetical protein